MPTPPSNADIQRVRDLTLDKCAGALSEEGLEELGRLIKSSEPARTEYLKITAIHAKLGWDFGTGAARTDALSSLVADAGGGTSARLRGATLRRVATWLPALAALLLIAVGVAYNRVDWGGGGGLATLAEVCQLVEASPDSRWSFAGTVGANPSHARAGDTIWLEQGAVDLHFVSNTVASLQAPVLMHVVSTDRVRVLQGGVKVEVAEGAEGFAVETESAEVIDLGTVFSVNVAEGNTDLVVFDGEVDLKVPAQDDALAESAGIVKRFRAGEAVQVSRAGTLSRIVTVQQAQQGDNAARPSRPALIAAVRDNNLRSDFYSYYEIVPGGMREDAKAFVDRPHEWNGATQVGMPRYLHGGDYVKTFNDDKVVSQLDVEVELASPATVYVLMDRRLTPPAWLVEGFVDTRDEIGIEEAPYYPDDKTPSRDFRFAVGPGAGVKRSHAIWKRECPDAGVVDLGSNGTLADDVPEGVLSRANMYGIVVVPAEDPRR